MKTNLRRLLVLLVALALIGGAAISASEAQKREMRSAWIATVWALDWPTSSLIGTNATAQQALLDKYLEQLAEQNFNAAFFQVRSMCDAMYQSSYEPWSSYLTGTRGKDPGWDPLAYAIAKCHALGLQCHAWVNPYRYSTGSDWSTDQDVALQDADMLISYTSGNTTYTILNPGLEATRQRIVNVCQEIISNYEVDGIVFDDYFYPNGIPTTSAADDYDLWKSSDTSLSFADWRRANVNQMVADVYNMIQQVKPEVRFGISPAGVAGTSSTTASTYGVDPCPKGSDWQYNGIFSDPLAWLSAGTIDYISPQIYWKTTHSTNPFGPITQWWSYIANHFGRHHYASHSISSLSSSNTSSDWSEVASQIAYSRSYNQDQAPGAVLYSIKYINGSAASGLGNYLHTNVFTTPALVPAVTWKTAAGYSAPQNLVLDGATLTWTAQPGTLVKYSVYAVPENVTVDNAVSSVYGSIAGDYLVGVTYDPSFTLGSEYLSGYWYAVCVVDGYGNESEPSYLNEDAVVTYDIEKLWEITDGLPTTADARQGFGLNGKFYINDKATQTIYVYDENGLTETTYAGGANCGITRDQAGNLVVSNAVFPNAWDTGTCITVINPTTSQATTLTVPDEALPSGRCDFLGFAKGDLTDCGEIYLVGGTSGNSISRIAVNDGAVDEDNSYLANCDDVTPSTSTVINYYTDLTGDEALLYVSRTSNPQKLAFDGDNFTATAFTLPNKGTCNGAFPFVWDGKELILYPTVTNYLDGFAVAEANATTPLASVEATATANANAFQADWLNAEVDANGVTIYQYYPGGHLTVWRLTKSSAHDYAPGDVNHDGVVNISDVTALIDRVLANKAIDGCCETCCDVNLDGVINISDVTALIDLVLAGN